LKKQTLRIVIVVSVLISTFVFGFMVCFIKFNEETSAQKIERTLKPINKSVSDNGITFTIGNVIKDGRERITFEYVIKCKKDPKFENIGVIMEKPDIYINGKWINHSSTEHYQKAGKNEYRGVIEIRPVYELPNHYDVKFNVDQLLDQPGQWTIDFSL
jgi:hypothetical protein